MKAKPKEITVGVHPTDLFRLVQEFSTRTLQLLEEKYPDLDKVGMTDLSEEIMELCHESGLEMRIVMVILLELSNAMYHTMIEHQSGSRAIN